MVLFSHFCVLQTRIFKNTFQLMWFRKSNIQNRVSWVVTVSVTSHFPNIHFHVCINSLCQRIHHSQSKGLVQNSIWCEWDGSDWMTEIKNIYIWSWGDIVLLKCTEKIHKGKIFKVMWESLFLLELGFKWCYKFHLAFYPKY